MQIKRTSLRYKYTSLFSAHLESDIHSLCDYNKATLAALYCTFIAVAAGLIVFISVPYAILEHYHLLPLYKYDYIALAGRIALIDVIGSSVLLVLFLGSIKLSLFLDRLNILKYILGVVKLGFFSFIFFMVGLVSNYAGRLIFGMGNDNISLALGGLGIIVLLIILAAIIAFSCFLPIFLLSKTAVKEKIVKSTPVQTLKSIKERFCPHVTFID